jgi:hypothetical protein
MQRYLRLAHWSANSGGSQAISVYGLGSGIGGEDTVLMLSRAIGQYNPKTAGVRKESASCHPVAPSF